jgi:hypothetical protein
MSTEENDKLKDYINEKLQELEKSLLRLNSISEVDSHIMSAILAANHNADK